MTSSVVTHPKVLIVDDEAPIRTLIARWVSMWGYPSRNVGSALDALNAMRVQAADIVICDINMPEHDGLWLAEHLRAEWPSTVVIMATGLADAPIIRESKKIGAAAYVTKPFDPYVLRQAVDLAAGRIQFRS